MEHRFCFFGTKYSEQQWLIADDEFHHLKEVLKLKKGDEVEVIDGLGSRVTGRLGLVSKKQIEVVVEQKFFETKPAAPVILLLATLKPQHLEELLPTLVETGVDEIYLFAQEHTDKRFFSEKTKQRALRIIKTAMKQCKRVWLPKVEFIDSVAVFLDAQRLSKNKFLLTTAGRNILDIEIMPGDAIYYVVGSEAGLSEPEQQLFGDRGFQQATLGANVLRAVTAAGLAGGILSLKRQHGKKLCFTEPR